MKDFLLDFLKILSNCILIICFALCSFLFILNIFHYKEVSYAYNIDFSDDFSYRDYKKKLDDVDKKMNSVDYNAPEYATTAKPIYQYYKSCSDALKKGKFYNLNSNNSINSSDIYDANNEIIDEYNNICAFSLVHNISLIEDNNTNFDNSIDSVKKNVEEKREILLDNSEFLVNLGLSNSSYSFSTDSFKSSIHNPVAHQYRLTVNNYEIIFSILDEIADWYVLEFGGNR